MGFRKQIIQHRRLRKFQGYAAGLEDNSLDWIKGREDYSKDVFNCKVKQILWFIWLHVTNNLETSHFIIWEKLAKGAWKTKHKKESRKTEGWTLRKHCQDIITVVVIWTLNIDLTKNLYDVTLSILGGQYVWVCVVQCKRAIFTSTLKVN